MEIILSITIILSLLGNFFQHNKIQNVKEDNKIITIAAEKNYNAYIIAIKANEEYEYIITDMESASESCNKDLEFAINKFDRWQDSERLQESIIKDLEERLSHIDYSDSCVVPAWVDFEAGEASISSVGTGDDQ
jgi:predicted GTPase